MIAGEIDPHTASLGELPMPPFGDRALRGRRPDGFSPRALVDALRSVEGVVDVVVTEGEIAVYGAERAPDRARIEEALASRSRDRGSSEEPPREVVVRVRYEGADLDESARALGLSPEALVRLHTIHSYEVRMMGFLPGFAYLGDVDPALRLARRTTPRARVAAGSVAIAERYTAVYPFASPGGWNLIGTAVGFAPFSIELGDRVRFEPTDDAAIAPRSPRDEPRAAPDSPSAPAVRVERSLGLVTIQDAGRPGRMHLGVPPGGALVPEGLARANEAAGNTAGAAAIEIVGQLEIVAERSLVVGDDGGVRRELRPGDRLSVFSEGERRVRYLALGGGVDVPEALGGRGTLLVAQMGGFAGRVLRRGDGLATAAPREVQTARISMHSASFDASLDPAAPLAIVPGPDATDAVLDALTRGTFLLSPSSDRTGARLAETRLPGIAARVASTPMVRGAIQLPPSGEPIVLGPDHPTTGGYPVVAVVLARDWGRLEQRAPGAPIRFALGR